MTEMHTGNPLRTEFVEAEANPVAAGDYERLCRNCGDPSDPKRLRRYLRRCQLGEPLEYILGFLEFRGRRFAIDKRVYITDPELTHLVDAVIEAGNLLAGQGRAHPTIVEFGVGCGSLAISLKKEFPAARVIGIDLDSDAVAVAQQNALTHHADVWLFESDLCSGLPGEIVPDIIFGDPPWGDEDSVYDETRPASHYHAMPPLSAFPVGGVTAVHEALLDDVAARGWSCSILLNLGVLGDRHVQRLAAKTRWHETLKFNEVAVLHAKMNS